MSATDTTIDVPAYCSDLADRAVADRLMRLGAYVNAGDPMPLIENLSRFGDAIRAAQAAGAT